MATACLFHFKCVFFKTSERLQAVISALTSGKFYWLPPDKENPEFYETLLIHSGATVSGNFK